MALFGWGYLKDYGNGWPNLKNMNKWVNHSPTWIIFWNWSLVVHQSPSHPYPIKRGLMKSKSESTLKATFTYIRDLRTRWWAGGAWRKEGRASPEKARPTFCPGTLLVSGQTSGSYLSLKIAKLNIAKGTAECFCLKFNFEILSLILVAFAPFK